MKIFKTKILISANYMPSVLYRQLGVPAIESLQPSSRKERKSWGSVTQTDPCAQVVSLKTSLPVMPLLRSCKSTYLCPPQNSSFYQEQTWGKISCVVFVDLLNHLVARKAHLHQTNCIISHP